jgi:hypothetical protein
LRKRLRLEQLRPLHLLLAGAVLFVLTMAITLSVLLAASKRGGNPLTKPQTSVRIEPSPLCLRARDFILEEPVEEPSPEIFFFRPPLSRWSEEQVRHYWVPLDQVVLETLRRENDRRVEKMFERVP